MPIPHRGRGYQPHCLPVSLLTHSILASLTHLILASRHHMRNTHVRGTLKLVLNHRGADFLCSIPCGALEELLILLAAASVLAIVLGAHL
jgi:hypothetical protein